MLAAEKLGDQSLETVLDLLLLSLGDIAANLRPRNQQNECHLKHLLIAEQESHLRKALWVAGQRIWVPQIYRIVVHEAWRLQVRLRIHLDVVDLKRRVGAEEFMVSAAASLHLVLAFGRDRHACDALQLHELLADG